MTTKKQIKETELTAEILTAEKVFPIDTETYYREFLNEICEPFKVGDLSYEAGRTLEEIDPTAFRAGMLDQLDCEQRDGNILEIDGFYFWKHEIEATFEITEDGD